MGQSLPLVCIVFLFLLMRRRRTSACVSTDKPALHRQPGQDQEIGVEHV